MYPSLMALLPVKDQTRKLPTPKGISAHRRSLPRSTPTISLTKSSVPRKRKPRRPKRARGRRLPRMRMRKMKKLRRRVSSCALPSPTCLCADRAHDQHNSLPLQKSLNKNPKRPPPLQRMQRMLGTRGRSCYRKKRRRS